MGHSSITLGLLFGLASLASSQVELVSVSDQPAAVQAGPAASNDIQDVTAVAVVESLRSRFSGSDVEFKFDSFASDQASEQDHEVHGAGRFRLVGGQMWMPVRYSALYDTATSSIQGAELVFAAQSAAMSQAPTDLAALDAAVARKIADEFSSQAVDFDLGAVTLIAGDARYAMAQASGVANFAGEGAASVTVQALFDRGTGRWLGVSYTLGDAAA